MPEYVTLTTPVYAAAGVATFRLWHLELRRAHPDRPAGILAIFREVDGAQVFVPGGKSIECRYDGDTAQALVASLNKVNLATISLEKRVTQRCQTDGLLGAGTIAGTPE